MRQAGLSGLIARSAEQDGPGTWRPCRRRTWSNASSARRSERALDRRHHLPAHLGGVAVSRRCPGRLQPSDRGLVDGRPHALRARRRHDDDGCRPPAEHRPGTITTPTKAGNTCLWGSGSNAPRPGSPGRWAPPASAGITPSPETFFAILNKELVWTGNPGLTCCELSVKMFENIEEFYNRQRRHCTRGMLSPSSSSKDLSARRCQTVAETTRSTTDNYPVARKRSAVHRSRTTWARQSLCDQTNSRSPTSTSGQ